MSLRQKTLSGRLADELCREIREKRLLPGSPLGTEAELAERFGVSRTVVREAIGTLRGLGVVRSRQGQGLSVAAGHPIDALVKAFVPLTHSREHWAELRHLRYVLEIGSVALAVERATHEQIARLRGLAEEMLMLTRKKTVPGKQLESELDAREVEFHQIIFEAAGGRLAEVFRSVVVEYFADEFGRFPHTVAACVTGLQEHLRLVEAFEARDGAKAFTILSEHLRPALVREEPARPAENEAHETIKNNP